MSHQNSSTALKNEELDLEDEIDIEFEGDDDALEPIVIEKSGQKIRTKSADPEIESLHNKYKRGKLVLQPEFQRDFVWDSNKASCLIESVLLDVPLPIIYLAQEEDGKELVIDGQQRLTSFFSFIDGKFPNGEGFYLKGLKVLSNLNRKTFSELETELQDKIRYSEIRVITILSDSNSDLKFEIFERLNTGSVPLNDMELRNCVYRGPYMQLLTELAETPEFLKILGLKAPDKRMKTIELVLRFASFYHASYLKYQSPMRQFFNRDMARYQFIDDSDIADLKQAFKNSTHIIFSLFGENAFKRFNCGDSRNYDGKWESKKFNASLYDVLMNIFADKNKNLVHSKLDSLREGFIDLMVNNEQFKDAILLGTSQSERVRQRFDIARHMVDEILSSQQQQSRCFTREFKLNLYNLNPTCAICGQHIQLPDDAAVDHIEQYWKGGQTIPENARLTHRYCNWSRSRKD